MTQVSTFSSLFPTYPKYFDGDFQTDSGNEIVIICRLGRCQFEFKIEMLDTLIRHQIEYVRSISMRFCSFPHNTPELKPSKTKPRFLLILKWRLHDTKVNLSIPSWTGKIYRNIFMEVIVFQMFLFSSDFIFKSLSTYFREDKNNT